MDLKMAIKMILNGVTHRRQLIEIQPAKAHANQLMKVKECKLMKMDENR